MDENAQAQAIGSRTPEPVKPAHTLMYLSITTATTLISTGVGSIETGTQQFP
jgi:hypothetical protein